MASIYLRGAVWWCRLRDEQGRWINRSTGCRVEADARRYALTAQAAIDRRRAAEQGAELTVSAYAARWIKAREARGIDAASDEERRLRLHILPRIGTMRMRDVRPVHVRDVIRAMRATGAAPRTVLHVWGAMRGLFGDAVVEEVIESTPCRLARGELPRKVDADPEWRALATYTRAEVRRLITDLAIPHERRVQYAIKALAGARHSEVAALCWRHYDTTAEPLASLVIARGYNSRRRTITGTKTQAVTRVPVHLSLRVVLDSWRARWPHVYGREPDPDDLIVPTRNGTPVHAADAGHAMTADLQRLGLRVTAGSRKRGGHDLRSWFQTQAIEDGADSTIIRRVTHAPPTDVAGGYERFSWQVLCREVSKLAMDLDGDEVGLATAPGTVVVEYREHFEKVVTPKGLEASFGAHHGAPRRPDREKS